MPPRLAAVGAGSPFHAGAGPSTSSSSMGAKSAVHTNGSTKTSRTDMEDEDVDTLYLQPAAFKRQDRKKWQEGGRSVAFGVSPVSGEIASWVTYQVCPVALKWLRDPIEVCSRQTYLARHPQADSPKPHSTTKSSHSHPSIHSRNLSRHSTPNLTPSLPHCNISSLAR